MFRTSAHGRHRRPKIGAEVSAGRPQGRPNLRRTAGILLAVATVAAATLAPLATASTRKPVVPHPSVRLPAGAEALSPYLPQVSCDPRAKPGVVAFRALMLATYRRGSDGGIVRACADGGVSEHKEGRAWDWMLSVHDPRDVAVANTVMRWLLSPGPHGEPAWNARRFGIMYVIWNGRIWGAYRPGDGWRPYVGASEHTDHIHFSFSWAGAERRTSWWTGHVAPIDYGPCQGGPGALAPAYRGPNPRPCSSVAVPVLPFAAPGDFGPHVRSVQAKLNVRPTSGFFGPRTLAALRAFQRHVGLAPTGVVDAMTAFRLGLGPNPHPLPPYAVPGQSSAHVRAVQAKLHVRPVSGFFGPKTVAAVKAFQHRARLAPTGVVDPMTAFRLGLRPNPVLPPVPPPALPPYARPGETSSRVVAVQHRLRVLPATGHYGPRTVTAVRAFQKRYRLPQTGVVDHATAVRMGLLRS